MPIPTQLSSCLEQLVTALSAVSTVSLDFETSGLDPTFAQIIGAGLYCPETEQAFYINIGHMLVDDAFPLYTKEQLAGALKPFVNNPSKTLIAHNATFEVRFLLQLRLVVRCRVICTMIHSHRVDENLRAKGRDVTIHYYTRVSYGLKELTAIYFNERPPTLGDITGGKAVALSNINDVAQYCVLDCYNAFRLHERSAVLIGMQGLQGLTVVIDDPNIPILARMMQAGVRVDIQKIAEQIPRYEQSIQACRVEIWRLSGVRWSLDTPRDILHLLRHLRLADELTYDPFWRPMYANEHDPSIARDILLTVFHESEDPRKRQILALIIAKGSMEQRLSAFLRPWSARISMDDNRLRPSNFTSTLVTTRFSSSPNLQNLPGRADAADEELSDLLPESCRETHSTRSIFIAEPGCSLVSMDLSAAEPRYLSLLFQRALTQRDEPFIARRKVLEAERLARYPVLMDRLKATRKPLVNYVPPPGIQWPTYAEDPLYRIFKLGTPFNDPYDALLAAMDPIAYADAVSKGSGREWLRDKTNRSRGKKAFLALGYGSSAQTLAPQLNWTVQQTEEAISNLETSYATLKPLRELTLKEMLFTGEVFTLWGRPRRINGYYQLARPEPVTICFYRLRSNSGERVPRTYVARTIPLGTTRQGVQAFVQECYIESEDGKTGEVVLRGDPTTGALVSKSGSDEFANADHFNTPPFRNISFSQINWVRDADGLQRYLPKQNRALRQAFNSMCQATGADHLRWLMNKMDAEVLSRPEFVDCRLILTVHDSLVFEVPKPKVKAFVPAGRAVMMARPQWCDFDMKVSVEVGSNYGDLTEYTDDLAFKPGCLGQLISWFKHVF